MTQHARLSASKSSTWLVCSGSLNYDDADYTDKRSSAGEDGTAIHMLSEDSMILSVDPSVFLGQKFNNIEIDDEHINIANDYIEYCDDLLDSVKLSSDNFRYGFEHRVAYTNWAKDGFGTMDMFIIDHENKTVHVIDLKSGRINVSAIENTQLMLYALGLTQELGIVGYNYRLHIIQPRTYNFDWWDCSYKDLMAFGEYVKERSALTLLPNPPRTASDKACKFCPNAPTCGTLRVYMDNIMINIFDEVTPMETLPLTDLAKIIKNKSLILEYIKKSEEYLIAKAQSGTDLKDVGFKLVQTNTRIKFNDTAESMLKSRLGDKAYKPQVLIGVTAARKLLDKEIIAKITFKPEGSITLAPLSDKRPEVKAVTEMFTDTTKSKPKTINLKLLKGL